ncbi:MAG: hypothetical protein ACKN9V_01225 [Pseudomonadota bacterium]
MRLLALLGMLILTSGCAQKLGRVLTTPQSRDTGPIYLATLSEITEKATLMATDRYLIATGARSGFGAYDFSSGAFISGSSALPVNPNVPNFLDGNAANVLSMVQVNSHLYVSSQTGLYQINTANISFSQVTLALPYSFPNLFASFNPNSNVPQFNEAAKDQFRWNSMVYVPNLNQIWGFRGNVMARLNIGTLSSDPRPQIQPLPINTSCGGVEKQSSAIFQGKVFVAACSQVLVLDPNTGSATGNFPFQINPVQVVATANRLYVHHQPVSSWGQVSGSALAGVYVFDANLNYINYIDIQPISFAISPNDQIIYANEDNSSVNVYRIP